MENVNAEEGRMHQVEPVTRKHWDSIDLCKFVLSMMVVLIHVNPFPLAVYQALIPFLRTAVPLFFIISSFFFFRKLPALEGSEASVLLGDTVKRLVSFTKRNLKLYLFWFVVLLVPTLVIRSWFDSGFLLGFFKMANSFLFHSTFIASWFIMALVICVWLVAILSLFMPNWAILGLAIPIYVVCALMSNYFYLPITQEHLEALNFAFTEPYNSFWVGIIWVVVGKMIAENLPKVSRVSSSVLWVVLAAGILLLGAEQAVIVAGRFSFTNDVFLTLPVCVIPIFLLVLRSNLTIACSSFLRGASTIVYCLHATLKGIIATGLGVLGIQLGNALLFVPVLCICLGVSWAILRLEDRRGFAWLRFSH